LSDRPFHFRAIGWIGVSHSLLSFFDHIMAYQSPSSDNSYEGERSSTNSKYPQHYKRNIPIEGYTGHFQREDDLYDLEAHNEKYMIRGYTGFRPHRRAAVGEPSIPNEATQVVIRHSPDRKKPDNYRRASSPRHVESQDFRSYAKHMDRQERYRTAAQTLRERGQSQEMLLALVQAKMAERVNSYAGQLIRTRKLYESFDLNRDGYLDEAEFRICLEKMNVQFDDVQALGLFAYFDHNNDGFIEWDDFADHAMVQNPRGGTSVLPKVIIAVAERDFHPSVANERFPRGHKEFKRKHFNNYY